MLLIVFKN